MILFILDIAILAIFVLYVICFVYFFFCQPNDYIKIKKSLSDYIRT